MKTTLSLWFAVCTSFSALLGGEPTPPASSAVASRDTGPDAWLGGKYLTGEWGGLRDQLDARGIDLFAFYTADPASNVLGGNRSSHFADDWFFGVNIFLDKLAGWPGARLVINAVNRDGSSVRDSVGSQFDPQQTVGGQNIFLYDVTFEQLLFDNKLSIKAGRFAACDDFNNSPIYNLYLTNAIDGDIRNVLFDTQFSAYPFATWAARITFDPAPDFHAKLGVFQNTSHVFDPERHGVDLTIGSHDGAFLIGQVGWTPQLFRKPAGNDGASVDSKASAAESKPQCEGLPGHYIFGGSVSPWNGYSQFGSTRKAGNSYGFYAHADQMVYRRKPRTDQGLVLWTAAGFYPQQNISIVPFQINAGFIYQGLLPARDKDKVIFGVAFGKFSRDYARTVEAAGNGKPEYETVLEGDYRVQITNFLYIQPDMQWIIHPGGTGRIPDALVLGMQTGVIF